MNVEVILQFRQFTDINSCEVCQGSERSRAPLEWLNLISTE